jgi:hypothetical protein
MQFHAVPMNSTTKKFFEFLSSVLKFIQCFFVFKTFLLLLSLETCISLLFINNLHTGVLVQSSVKPTAYRVTEPRFDLTMKFQGQQYNPVTFNASDPEFTQRKCLLNGRQFFTTVPQISCNNTVEVEITCVFQGMKTNFNALNPPFCRVK